MKTTNLLKLTVVAGSLLALTTQASILGTKHDFSGANGSSWNNDPADPATVCSVCHTPHNADATAGPLWSHSSSGHTFTMYSASSPGSQLKATMDSATMPNAASLACLTCHDGTVAYNTFGGVGNLQTHSPSLIISNSANVAPSGNLTHSHPISFTYNSSLVTLDKYLRDPSANVLTPANGNFIAPGTSISINAVLLGGNNKVECTSCHDVHNQIGTPYDALSNPNLLKINGVDGNGVGSLLCRSCHNK